MRKKWLGLASLLVGGGAVQAQQYPPMAPGYGPGYRPMPAVAPYGYGGVVPTSGPMGYPPPGAVPYGPAVPIGGRPIVPGGMPIQPAGAFQAAPLPSSPTVPMTEYPQEMFAGEPIAFHRPHCETFWFRGDYVLGWITNGPLHAPLITSGAASDPHPGALDPADTGTAVLFGGNGLNYGMLSGMRLQGGVFCDNENRYSVDIGALILSPTNIVYSASSDATGSPIFARPIINAATGEERSFLTSTPGALAGATSVESRTDLWSIDLNARRHAYWYEHVHAEGLLGFRTTSLRENIRITDNLKDLNGSYLTFNGVPLNAGDRLYEQDHFRVINQFYGFQLGSGLTFERDWFSFGVLAKVAAGVTDQETTINGTASVASPFGNSIAAGGILAQLTNMGVRHNYAFGVIPEATANLGINITKNIRFNTGYSFLMWNNVIRPGDLIDRNVNVGLPPGSPAFGLSGPARPAYVSRETTFYLNTFNFGLEIHY
jgi:hypothetical protein